MRRSRAWFCCRGAAAIVAGSIMAGCGDSTDDLVDKLRTGDPTAQREAAERLATSKRTASSIAELSKSALDANADVRRLSVYALGQLGDKAAAAAPVLLKSLEDGEPKVRWAAAHALARVDPSRAAVVAVLDEAYRGGDLRAILSLGTLRGDAATAAAARLAPLLKNGRRLVRIKAAESLMHLGPAAEGARASLRAALQDADEEVREIAARAIASIDGAAK